MCLVRDGRRALQALLQTLGVRGSGVCGGPAWRTTTAACPNVCVLWQGDVGDPGEAGISGLDGEQVCQLGNPVLPSVGAAPACLFPRAFSRNGK